MRTTEFVRVFAAGGFDVPSADGSGFDLLGALRAGVGAISDGIT